MLFGMSYRYFRSWIIKIFPKRLFTIIIYLSHIFRHFTIIGARHVVRCREPFKLIDPRAIISLLQRKQENKLFLHMQRSLASWLLVKWSCIRDQEMTRFGEVKKCSNFSCNTRDICGKPEIVNHIELLIKQWGGGVML